MCYVQIAQAVRGFKQEKEAGRAKASQLRFNATLGKMRAQDALDRGESDVDSYNKQADSLIGSQRANIASNNVLVDSGSALDVMIDTEITRDIDVETIMNNAKWEAWEHEMAAKNDAGNAGIALTDAKNRSTSTVLTSVGNGINQYRQNKYGSTKPA